MRVVFVDDTNEFAALPCSLTRVALSATMAEADGEDGQGSTDAPEDMTVSTAAEQRTFRDTEGVMALIRAMDLIKANSPDFSVIAEAARDQYLAETELSLEEDLFADFDDA